MSLPTRAQQIGWVVLLTALGALAAARIGCSPAAARDIKTPQTLLSDSPASAAARQRTSAKKARTSSSHRSGASRAGKWPPRGMSVQRTML